MILLLLFGLILLAAAGLLAARAAFSATEERQATIAVARSYGEATTGDRDASTRSLFQMLRSALMALALRVSPRTSQDEIGKRLAAAGLSRRISPDAFVAVRFVFVAVGLLLAFAAGGVGARGFTLGIMFGAAGVLLPKFLLARRASARAEKIAADVPNFVDRLAVAMEAGLSFDSALTHIIEKMRGPLAEELRIVLAEVSVGESRRGALQRLAERIDAPEVGSFASAILQAEQLGMSVSGILREQANDVRHRRHLAAEEKAMKAPVKMLFPIVIFILPVMFVVVLAPPIINVVKGL
jgi:tight adherence protein C